MFERSYSCFVLSRDAVLTAPFLSNTITERIDPNELLNRVDVNKQLERVDINALMKRVDIDDLVQRSNLAAIVAESSSGVFTGIMDTMRIQIVDIDLWLYRWFQCNRKIIPPAPGKVNTFTPYPNGKMEKAIAVQEHYCGIFSKGMALLIDWLIMLVLLAIITTAVDAAYRRAYLLFVDSEQTAERLAEQDDLWVTIVTLCAWFLYFWLFVTLPGQTIGMSVVGVRVVNVSGTKDVSFVRAAIRTAALWVVIFCWPVTIWVGIIRRIWHVQE